MCDVKKYENWRPKRKNKEIFMKWLVIFFCKRSRGR